MSNFRLKAIKTTLSTLIAKTIDRIYWFYMHFGHQFPRESIEQECICSTGCVCSQFLYELLETAYDKH